MFIFVCLLIKKYQIREKYTIETNPQKKVKMKMQDKIEKKVEQKNLKRDPLALINLKYTIHHLAF